MGSLEGSSSHSPLRGALASVPVREKHSKWNKVWTSATTLSVLGRYFRVVASALRGLSQYLCFSGFTLCCLHCNISSLHVQMFNQMNGKTAIPWRKMSLLQNCSFKWFVSTVFCTKSKECWNYFKKGNPLTKVRSTPSTSYLPFLTDKVTILCFALYIPIVKNVVSGFFYSWIGILFDTLWWMYLLTIFLSPLSMVWKNEGEI